ncbi:hypothetical protein BH09PLA1_BH09PLA1_24280 [soil metagenome]
MIPRLNEHGYLPPGVHRATLEEVIARFGHGNEQREAEGTSLRWLEPLARNVGATRMLINGSFVTSRSEPNDVDCVVLVGPDYDESTLTAQKLLAGVPFLEISVVVESEYRRFAEVIFATDRGIIEKGVVEVLL